MEKYAKALLEGHDSSQSLYLALLAAVLVFIILGNYMFIYR